MSESSWNASPPKWDPESEEGLRVRAKRGEVEAQYGYGMLFLNKKYPEFVEWAAYKDSDLQEGIDWLRKAAEQDHPKAIFELPYALGTLCAEVMAKQEKATEEERNTAIKNHMEACQWARVGVDAGNFEAIPLLADLLFMSGSKQERLKWKEVARLYGKEPKRSLLLDEQLLLFIASLNRPELTPKQIEDAKSEALNWFQSHMPAP